MVRVEAERMISPNEDRAYCERRNDLPRNRVVLDLYHDVAERGSFFDGFMRLGNVGKWHC